MHTSSRDEVMNGGDRCSCVPTHRDGFGTVPRTLESARGRAQSKTWRRIIARLCVIVTLCAQSSSLYSQPTPASRVLDLDGKTGYVELPPNVFNGLDEATV